MSTMTSRPISQSLSVARSLICTPFETTQLSSLTLSREGRSAPSSGTWTERSLLLANNDIVHDDNVGQLSALADEAALANNAALDADLLAEVGVDRGVEVGIRRDEDAGRGVGRWWGWREKLEGLLEVRGRSVMAQLSGRSTTHSSVHLDPTSDRVSSTTPSIS